MDNTFQSESHENNENMHTRAILFFLHGNRRKLNQNYNPQIQINQTDDEKEKQLQKQNQKPKEKNLQIESKGENKNKEKETGTEKGKTEGKEKTNKGQPQYPKANFDLKMFVTEILAQDPIDGKVKHYSGPHILAKDMDEANWMAQNTGLGYCKVIGELLGLIDTNGNDVKDAYKLN